MKKFLITLIISILYSKIIFAQQAWTSPKGKFYSQLGFTHLVYDGYSIANQFEIEPLNRRIVHHSLQGYLQYGITDKLMLTAVAPFSITSSEKIKDPQPAGLTDGKLNAFSNLQAGLTYKIYEKNGIVTSAKMNMILPTAKKDLITGLRSGDDAFGVAPSLLAGYGHAKFFTSAEIGYTYRTNNYSGQTLANFQIGKHFGKKKKWLGILHADLRLSAKNGTYDDGNTKYTATYLNNLSYVAYGMKFGYKITPKMMFWTAIRFWATNAADIGSRTDDLGLFPGLTFSVSYQN
jgi:hypothetical protein